MELIITAIILVLLLVYLPNNPKVNESEVLFDSEIENTLDKLIADIQALNKILDKPLN
jgi:hypothetical protein